MITDLHTHVWTHPGHLPDEFAQELSKAWGGDPRDNPMLHAPAERHWEDYKDSEAERVVVLGFCSRWLNMHVPNEYVAEYVRQHPERLLGFASVDPHDISPAADLEHAVRDLGLKGLKLGPVYQSFHPMDRRMMPVYRMAQDLGIPVLFHQGTTFLRRAPLKYAHPGQLEEVALAFPDLKMVIAHMGHPWEQETIVVIRKQPNVYADISALGCRPWQFYNSLRLALEYRVLDKLLFGTDYPAFTVRQTIEWCSQVIEMAERVGLPEVPREPLAEIIHRSSLELLGIT